jgi:hypothetical protein
MSTRVQAGDGSGKEGGGESDVYDGDDCAAPRFVEQVHTDLFGAGEQILATAPYVQTIMFYGCAVNNTHVTDMFDKLKNLRVVALLNSPVIVPPFQLPDSAMTNESQLTALRLDGMGVGEIPSGIGRIGESLSVLSFNRNRRLQTVPPEVGQCINLALLYLADNAITSVPSELGRLTGLATLSLEGNTLSSLPVELGSLTNIQKLYLGRNRLEALPSTFGRLTNLAVLDGSANRLTAVPILDAQPQTWSKLRYMKLEGNRISAWPKDWTLERIEEVAQLPFNTTTSDLYDTYVARRRTEARIGRNSSIIQDGQEVDGTLLAGREVALVLMSGNPVVNDRRNGSMAAQLWEFSRGGDTVVNEGAGGSAVMLVSSKGDCAPGCWSTTWQEVAQDHRGDSSCHAGCNVTSCSFDGGDCARAQ